MIKLLKNFKNIFTGIADGIRSYKLYKQGKVK
jgi:hypothetical protein